MKFGSNTKKQRLALKLTLEELAERSGISRAMLSDVERDLKNPTIKVAAQIAAGLDCTLSDLLEEEHQPSSQALQVTRKKDQPILIDPRSGTERRLLAPAFVQRGLEIIQYSIPPLQSTEEFPPHQPGVEEYLALVQGVLQCQVNGQEIALEAGDGLSFRADVAHSFRNPGSEPCLYFLVIDSTKIAGPNSSR